MNEHSSVLEELVVQEGRPCPCPGCLHSYSVLTLVNATTEDVSQVTQKQDKGKEDDGAGGVFWEASSWKQH